MLGCVFVSVFVCVAVAADNDAGGAAAVVDADAVADVCCWLLCVVCCSLFAG